MLKMNIRERYLESNGKHSFQVYDAVKDHTIWTCPDWFDTKAEAENLAKGTKEYFTKAFNELAIPLLKGIYGADTTINTTNEGNEITMDIPETPPMTKTLGQQLTAVVAEHKASGQYGFVIINEKGDVVVNPWQYYPTPEAALEGALRNKPLIQQKIAEAGYGTLDLTAPSDPGFVQPPLNKIQDLPLPEDLAKQAAQTSAPVQPASSTWDMKMFTKNLPKGGASAN